MRRLEAFALLANTTVLAMAPAWQDARLVGLLLAFMLNIGLLIYLRPFALSSPENIKSVLHSLGGLGRLENLRYKSKPKSNSQGNGNNQEFPAP